MACFPATKVHVFVDLRQCHNCPQSIPAILHKKIRYKACANATAIHFTASFVDGSAQRLKKLTERSVLCRSQDVDQDFIDAINNVRDIVLS